MVRSRKRQLIRKGSNWESPGKYIIFILKFRRGFPKECIPSIKLEEQQTSDNSSIRGKKLWVETQSTALASTGRILE
jgi:hypothetical protein